jgi:hypothetical protein
VITTAGRIGIGNTTPAELLEITGAIKIGATSNLNAGTVRWTGSDFEGYDGSSWKSFTSGGGSSDGDWTISGSNMYSAVAGNVGIGLTAPSHKLEVLQTGSNYASRFQVNNSSHSGYVIYAVTNSSNGGYSIVGENTYTGSYARVGGYNAVYGASSNYVAVDGYSSFSIGVNGGSGSYTGVRGYSNSSGYFGVRGDNYYNNNYNYGCLGGYSYGAYGYHEASDNYGALGSSGWGVYGYNYSNGTYGYIGGSDYAVYGYNSYNGSYGWLGGDGPGVYGGSGNQRGVYGTSNSSNGVYGESTNANGVEGRSQNYSGIFGYNGNTLNQGYIGGANYGAYAKHNSTANYGILGSSSEGVFGYGNGSSYGVSGYSVSGNAIWGGTSTGYAGYFAGNVYVSGTLSKGGGSFKIDHPLDPENKYLYHSFVESPDMMNIYNGNVILDANGEAIINLPGWFDTLNRDFRYQLTAIGAPSPNLYVAQEINNNFFKIAGGTAGAKISWQVTGIRQDAFANAHRIPVEEMKPADERGKYLHPLEHNVPASYGLAYEDNRRLQEEKSRLQEENVKVQQQILEQEQQNKEMEQESIRLEQEAQRLKQEAERIQQENEQHRIDDERRKAEQQQ